MNESRGWDFLGGPVVKTVFPSTAGGHGFNPLSGN